MERSLGDLAKILDGHLAGREWIAHGRLTLADLSIASPLMIADQARLPLEGCTHIAAWLERVQALDAWKRTIAREPRAGSAAENARVAMP